MVNLPQTWHSNVRAETGLASTSTACVDATGLLLGLGADVSGNETKITDASTDGVLFQSENQSECGVYPRGSQAAVLPPYLWFAMAQAQTPSTPSRSIAIF